MYWSRFLLIGLAFLAILAGGRAWQRARVARARSGPPPIDDEALRRILDEGTLVADDDEPLDLDEVARAEEEFWQQTWDEPEEFPR